MRLTREKLPENHIFGRKSFIVDKKQTEKWNSGYTRKNPMPDYNSSIQY